MSAENASLPEQNCDDNIKGPYVPMHVEEVSVVTSLKHWTNVNVRVVGKFSVTESSTYYMHGVSKDQGNVCLNLENLCQYPKHGDIIEVFGKLCIDQQAPCQNLPQQVMPKIALKVMFFTPIRDVTSHKQIHSLMKPFIPSFINKNVE